jgi:hypothetical protein
MLRDWAPVSTGTGITVAAGGAMTGSTATMIGAMAGGTAAMIDPSSEDFRGEFDE